MGAFNTSHPVAVSGHPRADALAALFNDIAQTRMADVPVLNPALRVEALGFELCRDGEPEKATPVPSPDHAPDNDLPGMTGVLITPWFMNLVWIPLVRLEQPGRVGRSRSRLVGVESFDFIGGYEPAFGSYEACSLFSPMFEFNDQDAASATARAVLQALRQPVVTPSVGKNRPPDLAARRAFLFGRRAGAEGVS